MFPYWQVTAHCFVDDPAIILGGPVQDQEKHMGMIVLLWCALGCDFSWPKGAFGTDVNWIGARVAILNKDASTCARTELPTKELEEV